jgi:hypothetical protein
MPRSTLRWPIKLRIKESQVPERIQLRRSKGWRMPPNTVKVDRTTKWGNPFIVGTNGSAIRCVYYYILFVCGLMCLSAGHECCNRQSVAWLALIAAKKDGYAALRGKNLACWCKLGAPCHADVLLEIVNRPRRGKLDLDDFMARYGYRRDNGELIKLEAKP